MLNNRFIPYNSFVHSHLIKYSIAKNREKSKYCQPAVPHLSSEKNIYRKYRPLSGENRRYRFCRFYLSSMIFNWASMASTHFSNPSLLLFRHRS